MSTADANDNILEVLCLINWFDVFTTDGSTAWAQQKIMTKSKMSSVAVRTRSGYFANLQMEELWLSGHIAAVLAVGALG